MRFLRRDHMPRLPIYLCPRCGDYLPSSRWWGMLCLTCTGELMEALSIPWWHFWRWPHVWRELSR